AAKRADLFIHYLSYVNLAAALPVVLALLLTHQIYYLFAGMLVNALIFLVLPVFQGLALKGALHLSRPAQAIRFFALNGLAFVGYSYTIATGHWAYYKDARRGSYEPFKATSVDQIEHSFKAGWGLLRGYARKHPPAIAAYLAIGIGCLTVLADQPPHLIRPLVAAFVLGHAIAPAALTPQLFAWTGRASRANPLPADAVPAPSPHSPQALTAGQAFGSLLLSQETPRPGGKDGGAATLGRRRRPPRSSGSEHVRDAEPSPGKLARLSRRRWFPGDRGA
ncbi:MAG: hypothetical protein LBE08_05445, partial [Bifidobacteriaceae bacterium]|nr:hypothetical protein [Bifidobacteriaceae bacterium]